MPGSLLSYEGLTYKVPSKNNQSPTLVDNVSITIHAGELLAIMGPSGAGKSTLLDLMTFRKPSAPGHAIKFNGQRLNAQTMHRLSAFVEQEDALLGTLTVRESIEYSLRLHSPNVGRKEVVERVDRVTSALGLQSCAHQRIRTAFGRGISDGQKRRVTAACAMVTYPQILFLDEVTSGLDSTAAREVIAAIRKLALAEGMIVVATIHQPSMETMSYFDNLLMLAKGKPCYLGSVNGLEAYLEKWGRPTPRFTTPFEHAMNFLNDDFLPSEEVENKYACPGDMHDYFMSVLPGTQNGHIVDREAGADVHRFEQTPNGPGRLPDVARRIGILLERTTLHYSRSVQAYGVRGGMYIAMAVFVSTIWIRLGLKDSTINDRLAIHFFVPCFLASISVACIPAFLEERAVYYRESKNGLYTTLPFVVANTLVNLPFLFACATTFTLIIYWSVGLHSGAGPFFRYLVFVFLSVLIGESQTVFIASLVPSFMASLAISAFADGLLLCLCGFFIKSRTLPRFWFYTLHHLDYAKYAFELLANSDMKGLTFQCAQRPNGSCSCAYPTLIEGSCNISGEEILDYLEIGGVSYAKWASILVSMLLALRILTYIALRVRSK